MNKIISAFSWMLIHSIWQGLVLAVIVSVVLLLTKKWKAAARYNFVLLLFASLVPVAAITFIWEWNNNITTANTSAVFATGLGARVSQLFFGNLQPLRTLLDTCNAWFGTHEQLIVMLWLAIFAIKLIKTTGELYYHQQMKKRLVVMPDQYWKERSQQLSAKLQINKTVVLLESIYLKIPVVIGHLKPVILMPAGLLMSLPPEQAEAILLHELAHIKRNDYLVNFLQYAAETIFFFNPAILWISGWLREERENCCDDIALEQTQNNIGLAEALINFKQHQLYGHAYQTAFPGKKNQLLRRVSRILGKHDQSSSVSQKLFFAGVVILLFTAAATAMLVQAMETTTSVVRKAKIVQSIPVSPKEIVLMPVPVKSAQIKVPHAITFETKKIAVTEKTITIVNSIQRAEPVSLELAEPLTDDQKMAQDAEQAKKDQLQAIKDQAMAKLDQEQAMRDQQQALLDQQQAEKDQIQAKLDQLQAMRDNANAKAQQAQDMRNQDLLMQKKEAERKFKKQISL